MNGSSLLQTPESAPNHDAKGLKTYAQTLLSATYNPATLYPYDLPRRMSTGPFAFHIRPDDDDEDPGCREAIEILTRNPKKGSLSCFRLLRYVDIGYCCAK